jgi:UDP-N-acetylglucosamine--N-acetylmuramyl-(pentapeptide) pyrophosphoryl-undecaprenol N-acetylglucosamine transferase
MVMGGSQGARSINQAIRALLAAGGLGDVNLLWSTGQFTWEHFRIFDTPPTRQVRAFWDPIGEAYAAADLVVARAGAMTTAELCAWGLPAILIPLPTAAADHQTRNAEALAAAGAVIHLPDSQLSAGVLRETLGDLLESDRLVEMGAASAARGKPEAAASIAAELLRLAS